MATAKVIHTLAERYIDLNTGPKAILDWGCGPGRVIRHFPRLAGDSHQYSGSDYNEKYISWCRENIPGISFFVNELLPPVKAQPASFDMVYGLSIFTHLSEEAHYQWMEEIFRVLKPGGIFIFTTHGEGSAHKLTSPESEAFRTGKFVARSFMKEGHRMYSSFQPQQFISKIMGRFIREEFIPGGEESPIGHQDCLVFRKPFG
ncbi:MAG: class I SAM-dependent methyltransferase [Ferruginibacter sp.]